MDESVAVPAGQVVPPQPGGGRRGPDDHDVALDPVPRRSQANGYPRSLIHLTVTDVCDELGISKSTFYDWRAAHKAPNCIRLPNGSLRVRRNDLDNWLRDCEEPA